MIFVIKTRRLRSPRWNNWVSKDIIVYPLFPLLPTTSHWVFDPMLSYEDRMALITLNAESSIIFYARATILRWEEKNDPLLVAAKTKPLCVTLDDFKKMHPPLVSDWKIDLPTDTICTIPHMYEAMIYADIALGDHNPIKGGIT